MRAVIFDVDGTLCDVRPVRHYLADPKNMNFGKFHRSSLFCPPNKEVVALTHALRDDVARLVVTARANKYDKVTKDWLHKYGVRYDALYMRGYNDMRPDYVVKKEILSNIRDDGFEPIYAIDDNPNVVALWREHNIPTMVIPGWDGEWVAAKQ